MSTSKDVIKVSVFLDKVQNIPHWDKFVHLLVTYDEEGAEEGICVVPVWKWLLKE